MEGCDSGQDTITEFTLNCHLIQHRICKFNFVLKLKRSYIVIEIIVITLFIIADTPYCI